MFKYNKRKCINSCLRIPSKYFESAKGRESNAIPTNVISVYNVFHKPVWKAFNAILSQLFATKCFFYQCVINIRGICG